MFAARKLAFKNAYDKANDYAKLAGLSIIQAIKISEFEPANSEYEGEAHNISVTGGKHDDAATELIMGNMKLQSKLFCDFLAQ
jgi:uncharacterized protein YggE